MAVNPLGDIVSTENIIHGTDSTTLTGAGNADALHTHAHSAVTGQTANDHHNEDHASRHITAGADEIDGDQLDIDWNPTNYTPTTSPTEVTSLDHLTAHLAGIDAELASMAEDFQSTETGSSGQSSSSASWVDVTSFGSLTTSFTGGGTKEYHIILNAMAGPTEANGEGLLRIMVDGVAIESTQLVYEGMANGDQQSGCAQTVQTLATGKVIKIQMYALNSKQFTITDRALTIRGK